MRTSTPAHQQLKAKTRKLSESLSKS